MDVLDLQNRCEPLSADDCAIGLALDALDEKLREWLQELSACRVLIKRAWPSAEPAPPPAAARRAAPAPAEGPARKPTAAPAAPVPAPPPAEARRAAPAPAEGPARKQSVARVARVPAPPPADAAPEPPAASDEEEEALLASLDADIANIVRVRRRLTGKRRSVRELVEEIEASRAAKHKDKQNKSWWR